MATHHTHNHPQAVARYYAELSGPVAQAMARSGFDLPTAIDATTYAFNELARRPDITGREVSPIAWLRATARGECERLTQKLAPVPEPTRQAAPDLMAILKPQQPRRPAPRRSTRQTGQPGPQQIPGIQKD